MPTLSPTLRPQAGLNFRNYNNFKKFMIMMSSSLWTKWVSSCGQARAKPSVQLLAVHGFCHSLSISLSPRCAALSTAQNLEETSHCDFEVRCKNQKRRLGRNWDFGFLALRSFQAFFDPGRGSSAALGFTSKRSLHIAYNAVLRTSIIIWTSDLHILVASWWVERALQMPFRLVRIL